MDGTWCESIADCDLLDGLAVEPIAEVGDANACVICIPEALPEHEGEPRGSVRCDA